ncbi:MAG TPA: hypothetical protein HPP56_00025 [Nitrospirae bacterium]|nr:hypothetical protein [Nitrospirota bacterium]
MKKEDILRKRAQLISRERTIKDDSRKEIEVLDFVLCGERYAFETKFIKEVFVTYDVIKVPSSPAFLFGVVNYRGLILPIIDLRVIFGISCRDNDEKSKLIIISCDEFVTSIIVDKIGLVQKIKEDSIDTNIPTLSSYPEGYVRGISKGNIVILEAKAFIDDKSLIINESV